MIVNDNQRILNDICHVIDLLRKNLENNFNVEPKEKKLARETTTNDSARCSLMQLKAPQKER